MLPKTTEKLAVNLGTGHLIMLRPRQGLGATCSTVTHSSPPPRAAQPTAKNEPSPPYPEALRPIDAYPLQIRRSPCQGHYHFDGARAGLPTRIDFTGNVDGASLSHAGLPIRVGSTIRSLSHRRPGRYRWCPLLINRGCRRK
jgi:hypothetical protein